MSYKAQNCVGVRAAILAGTFAAFTVLPAQAADLFDRGSKSMKDAPVEKAKRKCDLSGSMALTTEYIFRGISFSLENPAIQGSVDVTCGIFYAGAWSSSLEIVDGTSVEIDYYAGITPSLSGFDFDFGGTYYTFPGAEHVGEDPDYFELKAGVSKTIRDKVTLGVTYYHAFYDGSAGLEDSDTVEGSWSISLPKVSRFSPSLSGVIGYEEQELTGGGEFDYTYWSVGLSAEFHERWTLDVRYWDTSEDDDLFNERVVGTISASF